MCGVGLQQRRQHSAHVFCTVEYICSAQAFPLSLTKHPSSPPPPPSNMPYSFRLCRTHLRIEVVALVVSLFPCPCVLMSPTSDGSVLVHSQLNSTQLNFNIVRLRSHARNAGVHNINIYIYFVRLYTWKPKLEGTRALYGIVILYTRNCVAAQYLLCMYRYIYIWYTK